MIDTATSERATIILSSGYARPHIDTPLRRIDSRPTALLKTWLPLAASAAAR
jgi:hypothetical protein